MIGIIIALILILIFLVGGYFMLNKYNEKKAEQTAEAQAQATLQEQQNEIAAGAESPPDITAPTVDQPAATPTGFADEKSDKGSDAANLAGSKGGGVGVQGKCRKGYVQSGALCYKPCPKDYISSGPLCIKKCPSGLKQVGITCAKDKPYGRGTGKLTEKSCGDNCEKTDGLWYKKCKSGYRNVGCCICTPTCPPGFTDNGAFCTPPSQKRGVGEPPNVCPPGKEYSKSGLCYDKCPEGYYRSGLLCKVNTDRL